MKFLELIKKYRIVIPVIQRDYSEGFKKSENDEIVGKMLINNIIDTLASDDATLDLNFVYGQVRNGTFFPVDGQQRLTTLFLLYLYLFKDDEKAKELFKKFSFEARRTSKDFFEKLIKYSWKEGNGNKGPKAAIKDAGWFLNDFEYDPTITSAVNVLDYMHDYITKKGKDKIKEKLASGFDGEDKCNISFQFLNVEKLGSIDNLYIKLNARGRALTTFEIFKSELLKFIENHEAFFKNNTKLKSLSLTIDNISSKLDGEWLMAFLPSSLGQIRIEIDYGTYFYNFFGNILKTNGIIDEEWYRRPDWKIDFSAFADKQKADKLCEALAKVFVTMEYMTNTKKARFSNKTMVQKILSGLKQLFGAAETKDAEIIKTILLSNLISQSNDSKDNAEMKIEYKNLIYFYAISQYLYKFDADDNFIMFLRVIKNLAENNYKNKIDKNEKLTNAIGTIKKFIEEMKDGNIIELLSCVTEASIKGFDTSQYNEEIIKAKIIKEEINKKWSRKIGSLLDGENHLYFLGRIGIWLAEILRDSREETFNNYIKILHCLFDENGVRDEFKEQILRRSMLSTFDYTMKISDKYTFCVDDKYEAKKSPSLKEFFTSSEIKEGQTECEAKLFLNKVLDENVEQCLKVLSQNDNSENAKTYQDELKCCIKKRLEAIIKENTQNMNFLDWRYCFIEEPRMFGYMADNCLRFCKNDKDNHYDEYGVRLLSGVVNRGVFMPSYLYYYAIKELNAEFEENRNAKCIVLNKNGRTIKFDNDAFVVSNNGKEVGRVKIQETEKDTFKELEELLK